MSLVNGSENLNSSSVEDGDCEIPSQKDALPVYRTILAFERDFNYSHRLQFAKDNWTISFYAVAVYLMVIVAGQWFMRSRPAFVLRWPLFFWNLGLSLISIGGALRITPEMYYIIQEFGFNYSVCSMGSMQHAQAVGFWVWLFCWSKLWELGDTAFIVLRKQKLIFLHWYHHITVLMGVWYGCAYLNSMGRWFMAANYLVHAFMYTYYALKSLKVRVPKVVSMGLTAAQILQMITCVYVTFHVYLMKTEGVHCCVPYRTLTIGVYLYASYLLLFLNYFLKAYVFTGRSADLAQPKKMD